MQRHGLDFSDIAGLLEHLGADCHGAVSCMPVGAGRFSLPARTDETSVKTELYGSFAARKAFAVFKDVQIHMVAHVAL